MTDYQSIARLAAVGAHGESAVGALEGTLQEDQDGVLTFLFASKLKGYPDWTINVTLYIDGAAATVSEVILTPSTQSLVAPNWVPWSERLADYKALQAAMEAEAAAALDAEDSDDIDEDIAMEDEDSSDSGELDENDLASTSSDDTGSVAATDLGDELALANVPETPETQDGADGAGGKGKGFFKWKTLRGGKKRK